MLRTIALVALLGMPAAAGDSPALRVWVYNYSTAPAETIAEMESRVGRLFSEAEVTLKWVTCDAPTELCPWTASPTRLVLRILPGVDPELPQRLGDAIHPCFADVWYGRVRSLPDGHRTVIEVLTYVAAHELAHLLLGPGAHSRNALMRPTWSDTDPAHTLPGLFHFNAEQRRKIKSSAIARTATDEAGRDRSQGPSDQRYE